LVLRDSKWFFQKSFRTRGAYKTIAITQITIAITQNPFQVGHIMGCFEDLMEFRDKVAKAETERRGKARLPGPMPTESGNAKTKK
jgi:hypothetical protein